MRSILLGLGLIVASTASAVPFEMTHQGRLLDVDGSPINTLVEVHVSLHSAAVNGTQRWTDSFSITPENGFYSVVLGTDMNNPLEVADLADPTWLSVRIGQVELGDRERLVAVPFALSAAHAETAASAEQWGSVTLDTSACSDGDVLRYDAQSSGFSCHPFTTSGSIVNVTTRVNATRTPLATASVHTLESFTVDKKSPTSYLFIQGTLSGWGNHSGSIQQGWRYGSGAEVLAQGVMYDNTPHGKVYPTSARIEGHTQTGPQTLTFRYYDRINNGGEAPFTTYNPNASDDNRLDQTRSVYVVWEIEP